MAVDYNVITHYIKNRYVFLITEPEKHISITKIVCKALIGYITIIFLTKDRSCVLM